MTAGRVKDALAFFLVCQFLLHNEFIERVLRGSGHETRKKRISGRAVAEETRVGSDATDKVGCWPHDEMRCRDGMSMRNRCSTSKDKQLGTA